MDINWMFQNKHMENQDEKWITIQMIEKDICYLYHQLSSYSYIMGDLSYSELYFLPYWDYVNITEKDFPMDVEKLQFIREGCLVIILAMAWEQIYGAGSYIHDKTGKILEKLKVFEPKNEKEDMLLEIVLKAVNIAKDPVDYSYEDISEESVRLHREIIRNYFRNMVSEFNNNPYFNK